MNEPTKQLTLGSLFDGISGFPLAGTYAGIQPVWASEIEPFPIRVATKRFPDMAHYGDMTAINGADLPPVDIITGGFPCTDCSIAGARLGLKHVGHGDEITTRSGLFYEAVRIIKEMRDATNGQYPRYFVGENVTGLFSSGGGEDYRNVLEALCQIKDPAITIPRPEKGKWCNAGLILGDDFSLAWRVLDAAQGWGVAQRRKRVFIVLDLGGQRAGKILFESEGVSGYTPPRTEAGQGAAQGAEGCAGATGRYVLNDQGGERMDVTCEETSTLRAKMNGHQPVIMASGFCTEHSANSRSIGYEEERSPTLRAGVVPGIAIEYNPTDSRIKVKKDGICQTLTARCGTGGNMVPLALTTPVAFGISSDQSNGMLSDNPHAGIYEAETSRTLDCNCSDPSCHQGGIAVCQPVAFAQNQRQEVRDMGDQAGALSAQPGIHQQTFVAQPAYSVRTLVNTEVQEEVSPALMARDYKDPTVVGSPAYCMTIGAYGHVAEEKTPTLEARGYKDPPVVGRPETNAPIRRTTASGKEVFGTLEASMSNSQWISNQEAFSGDYHILEPDYTVRRLTPLECTLLQGYPRDWVEHLGTEEPTEQEIAWWSGVFEVWNASQGKKAAVTRNRVIKWLKAPTSDAAIYKAMGNSVAVPCVHFVLAGIVWAEKGETP